MIYTICSTFPFMVCLCWFVTFMWHFRRNDTAKRVLTLFLGTCTVLYLCHAFYFNGGLAHWADCLWALCSLSVYPLYYIYITHLTCHPLTNVRTLLCLLPATLVALAMFLFPGPESEMVRKLLFAIQVFVVLYVGHRRLQAFDKEVANVYADTEGRDTMAVKKLLLAFVATSLLSAVANVVGKQNAAASEWLVGVLVVFGLLLHALSFIGYSRSFTIEQYHLDTEEDDNTPPNASPADDGTLGRKIEQLTVNHYFLNKNLKITDLAREVGSCRTYVSQYINNTYGCPFSDYVNMRRIEYAKQLLQDQPHMKMSTVADASGFSNEQAFYRNFKKLCGMTPSEWQEKENRQAVHTHLT